MSGLVERVPVSTRVDLAVYAMVGVAFVSGCLLAVAARWGQNVYPTRVVTRATPAAPISNASSAAEVTARFDGKPAAASVTAAQLPQCAYAVYTDQRGWLVAVCTS